MSWVTCLFLLACFTTTTCAQGVRCPSKLCDHTQRRCMHHDAEQHARLFITVKSHCVSLVTPSLPSLLCKNTFFGGASMARGKDQQTRSAAWVRCGRLTPAPCFRHTPALSQVILSAILGLCSTACAASLYQPDYAALIDLYAQTNGANWDVRLNWKRGDPCDPLYPWYGITCVWDPVFNFNRVQKVRWPA